jgi:hypothetical protein
MPTRKRKDDDGYGHDNEHRGTYKEEGHAVQVHQAYLEHRLKGGEPPTPEAYRRALEQFQKLPGAVQSTPIVPSEKPGDAAGGKVDDTDKKESGR